MAQELPFCLIKRKAIMCVFDLTRYPFSEEIYKLNLKTYQNNRCCPSFRMLSGGKKILAAKPEVVAYLALYSVHHIAKMDRAISVLDKNMISNTDIEIYDWGCGQALATLALLEGFRNAGIMLKKIQSINLVDASSISLQYAIDYVNQYYGSLGIGTPEINYYKMNFNRDYENPISINSDTTKIHLFSNILDVLYFEVEKLADLIKKTISGNNIFVCISPDYSASSLGFMLFENSLQKKYKLERISRESNQITATFYSVVNHRFEINTVKSLQSIFTINA